MPGDATPPPELPPGLLAEYLESARSQLGVLAGLAHRIAARSADREALDALRREIHKVHGSAGSYGFMDASRLAAGMEATVKDWVAHPDDKDVDRGSLAGWFVKRLAEMLGVEVPAAAGLPSMPRVGSPPRPPRPQPPPTPGPVAKAIPPTPPSPPRPLRPLRPPAPNAPAASPPRKSQPPGATPPTPTEKPQARPPQAPAPPAQRPAPAAKPRPAEPRPAPPPATPPPAVPSRDALSVPEVIYVEDDAALAELLQYGLRAHGYRFLAYRNGWDALRELLALDVRGTHPLLLLDVDLPALDGYSIFAALERDRPGAYRVVFTTVHGTEEEQLRGLEAGALDYLVKPISLRVALEKIKRWVGR